MSARAGITPLAAKLWGVHHFGITVQKMDRAFEFYTEVLGCTEVLRETDIHGDEIHNTLLMQDENLAHQSRVNPLAMSVPDLRRGSQLLDLRFVQFDNSVVELLQYRDCNQPSGSGDSFAPPHEQTSPAFPGTGHICFCVDDDTDFNRFMSDLEAEARRRGMTNVRANRTQAVRTHGARQQLPLEAYSLKNTEGQSAGLALMYCKGPEGEQLEFVQVLGRAKQVFLGKSEERQRMLGSRPKRRESNGRKNSA